MNETLSSSVWPNFSSSRPSLTDQFSLCEMNTWQQNINTTEVYSPDDYNVWSPKSNSNGDTEKESFIKSIWSTNASPNNSSTESNSRVCECPKNIDQTPTNSPSLKRIEIINCNDRWGNVKINQITPWNVAEIDDSDQHSHDPMVWRAKIDGTEVWEDYYLRQHGRRLPQTDSSFSNENVWTSASEISQSTNSIWPSNKNDISVPANDIFSQNIFSDINNRPNFNTPNGVRPSMTRNQAQKFLIDMGYSLSDAIGALVNNQMDLPKAINELQSKYRMSSNGPAVPNGMYPQTLSFNNRPGDNVNMTRIPPGTPGLNPMVGQNNPPITPMMAPSNFSNNFDMFHSDPNDQMLDSAPYMGMDPHMSQFNNRISEPKRQSLTSMNRDNSFRTNSFPNNAMNNRTIPTNCSGPQFNELNVLNQGMNRLNLGYNQGHSMMPQPSSKWCPPSTNGFNGLLTNPMLYGNNSISTSNSGMMLNNGASNMDLRQNYGAPIASPYGRSISKQQIHPRNTSGLNWLPDTASISPNGALNDISQGRLAKNMSCTAGLADNVIGIIIRKVQSQHIEMIKSICFESGAMINFQLQPHTQSILVHFTSQLEARRCMSIIQSQINVRVELINEDYMHCMTGANCQ